MAKLTGQFTTPSLDAQNNKTHKPFLHGVVFVFTGAAKVTRETDAKGKYSFDLVNGEYEVSVYLKGNTEKDRFDMRAGEKFVVTATTTADALEKWLQVIGNNGKDELATYYENLLSQMQAVYKQFQDDSEFVGSMNEPILRRGYAGLGGYGEKVNANDTPQDRSGFFAGNGKSPFGYMPYVQMLGMFTNNSQVRGLQIGCHTPSGPITYRTSVNGVYNQRYIFWTERNTTVDSNGNIKAASPIIKLFNDRIESNDSFKDKPIFQKLDTGVYKISNTLGLSKNGWTHNIPLNSNGRGYFRVKVEPLEDGCIVRVFKIKNVLNPDTFEIDVVDGDPVDIGRDQRWIDLRFHEEQEAEDEELLTQLDNLNESAH